MSLVLVTSENDFTICGCRAKTSYKVKMMASEPCVEQPGLSWEGWWSLVLPSIFSSQELGLISRALVGFPVRWEVTSLFKHTDSLPATLGSVLAKY